MSTSVCARVRASANRALSQSGHLRRAIAQSDHLRAAKQVHGRHRRCQSPGQAHSPTTHVSPVASLRPLRVVA
eukprot:scaffold95692_cov54-Phaeocystis_antarctica.AAC.1